MKSFCNIGSLNIWRLFFLRERLLMPGSCLYYLNGLWQASMYRFCRKQSTTLSFELPAKFIILLKINSSLAILSDKECRSGRQALGYSLTSVTSHVSEVGRYLILIYIFDFLVINRFVCGSVSEGSFCKRPDIFWTKRSGRLLNLRKIVR